MKKIPIQELQASIKSFNQERWRTQLEPSDLAKSIVLEAAELLEHFQRDATLLKKGRTMKGKDKEGIASEIADLFIYLFNICEELDIDPLLSIEKKLEKLAAKYPANYREGKQDSHSEYLRLKQIERQKKGKA